MAKSSACRSSIVDEVFAKVAAYLGPQDLINFALAKQDTFLEMVKRLISSQDFISGRVESLLHRYEKLDESNAKAMLNFLRSAILEFEDLGHAFNFLLFHVTEPGGEIQTDRENYFKSLVDCVMSVAESRYRPPKGILPISTNEDLMLVYEDPIICSILGHFFIGACFRLGHIIDDMRTVIEAVAKRARYFTLIDEFTERKRSGSRGQLSAGTQLLELRLRTIVRHLLSVGLLTRSPNAQRIHLSRMRFAELALDFLIGKDTDRSLLAEKFMLFFGPPRNSWSNKPTDFPEKTLARSLLAIVRMETKCLSPHSFALRSGAGELGTGTATEDDREETKHFYEQYGIRLTAYTEVHDVLSLNLKMTLCPVDWLSQSERVFVDGRATTRDLLDLSTAISSRISYLKRVRRYHADSNEFAFAIVKGTAGEQWFPENSAALMLLVGGEMSKEFLVHCMGDGEAGFSKMAAAFALADQKLHGSTTGSVALLQSVSAEPIVREKLGPQAWRELVDRTSRALHRHALALSSRIFHHGFESEKVLLMTADESKLTVEVIRSFAHSVRRLMLEDDAVGIAEDIAGV